MSNELIKTDNSGAIFQSICAVDPNILRVLLSHVKADYGKNGHITRLDLKNLYNCTLGLIFPKQVFCGRDTSNPHMDYATPTDETRRYNSILEDIEKNRAKYSRKPEILIALDALENLAHNHSNIQCMIRENFTPEQAYALDDAFRARFGDPVQRVVIGGSRVFEWLEAAVETGINIRNKLVRRSNKALSHIQSRKLIT